MNPNVAEEFHTCGLIVLISSKWQQILSINCSCFSRAYLSSGVAHLSATEGGTALVNLTKEPSVRLYVAPKEGAKLSSYS